MARPVERATAPASSELPSAIRPTIARTTRPRTSSTTAAPRMIRPSRVSRTRSSERTRAVMPIDVAVSAAPTKMDVTLGYPAATVSR